MPRITHADISASTRKLLPPSSRRRFAMSIAALTSAALLATLLATPARATVTQVFPTPASEPQLEAGIAETVTGSGDLPGTGTYDWSGGVTVVKGAAYVIDRGRIARVNLTSGQVTTTAGVAAQEDCRDAATGADVRFYNQGEFRMAGTDGTFIYTVGYCGLQRVDPDTGATVTFPQYYKHASVAGRYLYAVNNSGQLFQHDLQDFPNRRQIGQVNAITPIAADNDSVWYSQGTLLRRVDIATGEDVTVTTRTGLPGQVHRIQTIGGYLYAAVMQSYAGLYQLVRISKTDGEPQQIEGGNEGQRGFNFTKITGIAADGQKLYLVDSAPTATHLKTITPTGVRTFANISGPQLGAGIAETLTRSGDLAGTETWESSGGVAVAGGAAYVIDRHRLARVNLTTGEVTTAAGSAAEQGCRDSATGGDVRLTNAQELRMAGTDGAYIYLTGPCGLHRVDPGTGATSTFAGGYRYATVAGHYLYGMTTRNELFQHDLRHIANRRRLSTGFPITAITADTDSIWYLLADGLHRLNIATGQDVTIPSAFPGGLNRLQSIGDYLYANLHFARDSSSPHQLVRIAKADGKVQHIDGGDRGQDGFNFNKIAGIAADGRKLYIVDSQPTVTHLKVITPTDIRTFAPPAAGPELDAAVVSTVGGISLLPSPYLSLQTGGIAMLGKSVVAIDGRRVVRVDPATGAVTPIAGDQAATGCTNSSTGSAVRFGSHFLRMMGTDGVYIYIVDTECGPRRIDSTTGATTYIAPDRYDYGTVAGEFLYAISNSGTIYRHDLRSPNQRTEIGTTPYPGPIAADSEYVWHLDGRGGTLYSIALDTLRAQTTAARLPVCRGYWACDGPGRYRPPSVLVSAGNSLYAGIRSASAPYGFTTLVEIGKSSLIVNEVAGTQQSVQQDGGADHAGFSSIVGLTTAGDTLLIADSTEAKTVIRRAQDPFTAIDRLLTPPTNSVPKAGTRSIDIGGPTQPDAPMNSIDIRNNYTLVPEGNPMDLIPEGFEAAYVPGPSGKVLTWDPQTQLCTSNCGEIYTLSHRLYENEGGGYTWWHALRSEITGRTPEYFEADLVKTIVDWQRIFNLDGTVRKDFTASYIEAYCVENARDINDCDTAKTESAAETVLKYVDITTSILQFLHTLPGGRQPMLNEEQLAMKFRLQGLAAKACRSVPRGSLSKSAWGELVHEEFEDLVQIARKTNPKLFGETAYFSGKGIPKPPGPRQYDHRYPDAIFGATEDTPEVVFDLKSGLGLIRREWVRDLFRELPFGFDDIPVVRLYCP